MSKYASTITEYVIFKSVYAKPNYSFKTDKTITWNPELPNNWFELEGINLRELSIS